MKLFAILLIGLCFSPLFPIPNKNDQSQYEQTKELCLTHLAALKAESSRASDIFKELIEQERSGNARRVMLTWTQIKRGYLNAKLSTQCMAPSFVAIPSTNKE